jgi:glycosyltransferase involved in cell wall biosynthesis
VAVRISVALAARNTALHLNPLLDSLARQTEPPHELVVYDDASEDETVALLEEFRARAPFPVRIIDGGAPRGHVTGFLTAARRCEGEAIAFCDHDDVWEHTKLERCRAALDTPDCRLVLHATSVVDADLRPLGVRWPAIEESRLAPPLSLAGLEIDAPGMAMVFRRELLEVADFASRPSSRYSEAGRMLHDEWVFFLAGVLGPIQLLAEPLVLYRQHGANHSGGWVDHRRDRSLRPATDDYRRAAAHTGSCAEYLEKAAASKGDLAPRFAAGALAYRRASANWELRVALYEGRSRRARARTLRRLLAARAYRPRTVGGFGRAALGKDLAAGVALAVRPDSVS